VHEHGAGGAFALPQALGLALLAAAVAWYPLAAWRDRRRRAWPIHRSVLWVAGALVAAAALVGPLAEWAHRDIVGHMAGHVLLGMAAPLLLVASRPITLLLRALPAEPARRVSRLLRSLPVRVVSHPVVAGALNAGGLWLLYATPLVRRLHTDPLLWWTVQAHLLVAGFLFTAAMVGRDPQPHRLGFPLRAGVLVAVIAAHGILAKWLYAHPPAGVPVPSAEVGAMVMYYGGDAVDLLLIVLLCSQWYAATAPAPAGAALTRSAPPAAGAAPRPRRGRPSADPR
jgi:putative membrane protein